MAKIRITVKNLVTGSDWTEEYDKPGIGDNGNLGQAEDWAFNLIEWFNSTCKPGESHRLLVATELVGESGHHHDWYKRTDGMSVEFRGRLVDLFECRKCGVTGKKMGLDTPIKRDHKFRAKKYAECPR